MALEKRRHTTVLAAVAAVILFLVLVRMPLRVDGEAWVSPGRTDFVRAEFDGVLDKVFVHEGERVQRGDLLAQMQDSGAEQPTWRAPRQSTTPPWKT